MRTYRKHWKAAALAALALGLGALPACGSRPKATADPVKLQTEAINGFAFRTAGGLLNSREENLVYSPVSFYYALSLAASGAAGETEAEFNAYLGMQNTEELAVQALGLYQALAGDSEHSKLAIGTSVWHDEDIRLKRDFKKTAEKTYQASVHAVDFGDAAAAQEMGKWVQEQTGGTIRPELALQPDDVLRILNTIYFQDEWRDRLYLSETEEPFYLAGGETVNVQYMNKSYRNWGFNRGPGFTRADLMLKERGQMCFVLPDEGVSVDSLLKSADSLQQALEGGESIGGEVIFKIPQFTVSNSLDLKELMEAAGISAPFYRGDFSNLTKDEQVRISAITQDSFIAVNRDGVEASAFTDLAMETAAAIDETTERAEMILDRPFLFGIKSRGMWLFIGVCDNPAP